MCEPDFLWKLYGSSTEVSQDLEFVRCGRRCGDNLKRTMTTNKNAKGTLCFVLAGVVFFTMGSAVSDPSEMVWDGTKWVTPQASQSGTPQGDLLGIRNLIKGGEDKAAIKAVDSFLVSHTSSPACEEAMNLAGQASMHRGRYWEAYRWYERQIAAYPNGAFFTRALDREYKIGDAFMEGRKRRALKFLKLSARDEGIDILLRIVAHAPGTALSERAMLRIADYHYDRQEYPEAVESYDQFMRDNRQSSRLAYAMLQAAKGTVLMYRGVEFDAAPLLDATVRFQVFAQAFPKMAEKEKIRDILEEIRLQMAHKLYHTGAFYERTDHPVSARFYFRQAVKQYPGTDWAEQSQDRLDILGPGEAAIPMPLASETKTLPKSQLAPTSIEDMGANEKTKRPKLVAESPKPRPVREISQPVKKKSEPSNSAKPRKVKKTKPEVPDGPAPIPLEKLT